MLATFIKIISIIFVKRLSPIISNFNKKKNISKDDKTRSENPFGFCSHFFFIFVLIYENHSQGMNVIHNLFTLQNHKKSDLKLFFLKSPSSVRRTAISFYHMLRLLSIKKFKRTNSEHLPSKLFIPKTCPLFKRVFASLQFSRIDTNNVFYDKLYLLFFRVRVF